MDYLAHSAHNGRPEQPYQEHIENVVQKSEATAAVLVQYAALAGNRMLLPLAVRNAAQVHDLGKLCAENQAFLHSASNSSVLPFHHSDAGVAYLKNRNTETPFSQMLVSCHHKGLSNVLEEEARGSNSFRDRVEVERLHTNQELQSMAAIHERIFPEHFCPSEGPASGDFSLLMRMMLSCLSDGDYTDSAEYGNHSECVKRAPQLLPRERLEKLNRYVSGMPCESERNRLRRNMYEACKDSSPDENIAYCDSPVGSGKTTAVMAHLLKQAQVRNARRIFVVLPYTNIIQQSVKVYRKALTIEGENPEEVVAELHHLAEFGTESARHLNAKWEAPIVVTTAVAFFETLASNKPSALHKLHNLPGSVIFLDEAHAAMPAKLLPTAWHWMETLADEWSCYWVLASGSLAKYWTIKDFVAKERFVPSVVPADMQKRLMGFEQQRIIFSHISRPLSCDALIEKVMSSPGPRLIIMNTVQSAAYIADRIAKQYGSDSVMHLSTALTANDRKNTIEKVKLRLQTTAATGWVLVATSCVEAGVDFSFRTGFREMASFLSLLQFAGRVNRNGEEEYAEVFSFKMQPSTFLTSNKSLNDSISVLEEFFRKGWQIVPDMSTRAIELELDRTDDEERNSLLELEQNGCFPEVKDRFHIIDNDTVLVTADEHFADAIMNGIADWKAVQQCCVTMRANAVKKYHLQEICEGIYKWNLGYDSFLGVMKGVLSSLLK